MPAVTPTLDRDSRLHAGNLATLEPTIDQAHLSGAVAFLDRATHANGIQLATTVCTFIADNF